MTIQCIACGSFAFSRAWGTKSEPAAFAKSGFGTCKHRPDPGKAVSATYARECDKYTPNEEQQVAKLRAWLNRETK